jgi:predicted kinase
VKRSKLPKAGSNEPAAKPPALVVVTGPPAAGKTALSRRLAEACGLPLLGRDALKEILFDTLGWSDRAWSRRLGGASYELLFYAAEALLRTRHPCVLESNFTHEHNSSRLRSLAQQYGYFPYQILCRADPAAIWARLHQRSSNGERHPGHLEASELAGLEPTQVVGSTAPLAIGGRLIELDTTDFARLDFEGLLADLREYL